MALCSLWIKKSTWLWGSFFAIALLLAMQTHVAEPVALLPIGIVMGAFWILKHPIGGMLRLLVFSVAVLFSGALFLHFLPGFSNWNMANSVVLSPGAVPYNFWINFDKPLPALFILAWTLPLIQNKEGWKKMLQVALPLSVLGMILLLFLSYFFGLIAFDPKMPTLFFVWCTVNLFFVTIPEEAFLRGFIQKELFKWFGEGMRGHVGSVCVASLIFSLFHLYWVADYHFLLIVFAAGVIYGTLFQWTKSIEASILCHFLVNVIHMLLFTYPALAS